MGIFPPDPGGNILAITKVIVLFSSKTFGRLIELRYDTDNMLLIPSLVFYFIVLK